ncbi:MAG: 1-acyl-sn-glycerol-3-phosphate acyltransferase [Clostridia bacterium]|nr:1-acyl-sn-glycerol-3-phosphate acyltransferase [Clostridia bacterium]
MEKKNTKKKKWTRFRHRVVRNLLYPTLGVFVRLRYRVRIKRFREQEKRPYLILMNHQTAFDQFIVGMSFKGPIYYLASEDLFSNGWVSSLIRYLVEPIPIKKQTTDLRAILNCMRVAKEGGTIAIAPEGNRTYSGRTEYMSPSIVPLAKKLGMPIVLYRIEGGYGVHPRWSDVVRRGKMQAYVSRVVDPEEYRTMSDDELFDIIRKELYVDEAAVTGTFRHKKSAEYLERAIYVCPFCGLSEFESHKDTLTCQRCGRQVKYLPTKELQGVGFDLPFRFVADWYDYQSESIRKLDPMLLCDKLLYQETVELREVIPYKKKVVISKEATLTMWGDGIELCFAGVTQRYPFENLAAVTVLGKNKLNLYHGEKLYQIKGSKRFNALKYVHMYNRYLSAKKGEEHGSFLGI